MLVFVSLKPELSENRTGAQWDSQPSTSDDSANLNPFDAQVAQVAGSLKKEGHFPTPLPLPLQQEWPQEGQTFPLYLPLSL